jgi:hypothetical protein
VCAGQQPAVGLAHGEERDPEPAGVVAPLEAGLLVQQPDHDRGVAVVMDLRVRHRERAVVQAALKAAPPLVPGQDEPQRADTDEVVGQQPAERLSIVVLLGLGPPPHQVQDLGLARATAH